MIEEYNVYNVFLIILVYGIFTEFGKHRSKRMYTFIIKKKKKLKIKPVQSRGVLVRKKNLSRLKRDQLMKSPVANERSVTKNPDNLGRRQTARRKRRDALEQFG
jgi:hypothetical protein